MREQATTRFSGNGHGHRDPDQIQREIEQTRAELADTVAAVIERANLKRRAQEGAQRGAEAARRNGRPLALGALAIGVGAVAIWAWLDRRSMSRWEKAKRHGHDATDAARSWLSDHVPSPR